MQSGLGLGEAAHDLADRRERLLLHRLAAQLAQRGVRLGLERQAEQAGEERIGRLGVAGERAERGLQLEPHARLGRVDADAEPVAQEVAHRPVREVLGVRAGAALEEADAIAEAPARLDDEPRLADARLAGDRDDRAAAVGDRLAGLVEHGELAAAADDRHDRAHLRGPARARDARGTQRALDPAQLDLAERLELDAVLHLALGLGPDDDAALGRQLLQTRRDVGGVAERVVALGALVVVGQHDRAGVDRDAHGQIEAVAAAQLLAVGRDRGLDRERGAHGALGVVLVPDGRAEEREEAVAGELRDGAVEAPDLVRDQRHDLVEEELRALGPEPLADRRRADDVGEQHGHDALGSGRCPHATSYRRERCASVIAVPYAARIRPCPRGEHSASPRPASRGRLARHARRRRGLGRTRAGWHRRQRAADRARTGPHPDRRRRRARRRPRTRHRCAAAAHSARDAQAEWWLECREERIAFYERLGFGVVCGRPSASSVASRVGTNAARASTSCAERPPDRLRDRTPVRRGSDPSWRGLTPAVRAHLEQL